MLYNFEVFSSPQGNWMNVLGTSRGYHMKTNSLSQNLQGMSLGCVHVYVISRCVLVGMSLECVHGYVISRCVLVSMSLECVYGYVVSFVGMSLG